MVFGESGKAAQKYPAIKFKENEKNTENNNFIVEFFDLAAMIVC